MPRPYLVQTMYGLGDTVYQRPFLRRIAEDRPTYVLTPWPELVADLPNVHPVRPPHMPYRTQRANMERHNGEMYADRPRFHRMIRARYRLAADGDSIVGDYTHSFQLDEPLEPEAWDLPDLGPSPVDADRYAVIRPVTVRREWANTARNPDPCYVAEAAAWLREHGYHVVMVGALADGEEWLVEPAPEADEAYLHGELTAAEMLAAVQHADLVVGGVGFIVPVGLAARVPTVIIGGGMGGHNGPEVVTGGIDASRMRFILPDDYCRCRKKTHDCPKAISDFVAQFEAAVLSLVMPEVAA